jgi:phosphoribosyl 1,2-cyclic phosphodiesterase
MPTAGSVPVEPHPDRFSVHFLASGSSGNSTLVRDGDACFLIDFGLAPESLLRLLRAEGADLRYWREEQREAKCAGRAAAHAKTGAHRHGRITAAVVTHLHGDHMNPRTLRLMHENGVTVWLHEDHAPEMMHEKRFRAMRDEGLVRLYGARRFRVTPRTEAAPVPLPHDATATHGFVFERAAVGTAPRVRFAYLADLGHFRAEFAESARDCDLVALEFNHEPGMEERTRRPRSLVARVLGNHGHLSNAQAARALEEILARSHRVKPACVAALHISRDCNLPDHARRAAEGVLRRHSPGTDLLLTLHRECAGAVDLLAAAHARAGGRAAGGGGLPEAGPVPSQVVETPPARPPRLASIQLDLFGYE